VTVANFVELLRYQFDQNAHKPAIIYHGDVLTYAQLESSAENVGALLQDKGLEKGERVILYTADKLPFLIIHLGIILSGGVSLPLNFGFTKDEMRYFLNDSGARFVFASGEQASLIEQIRGSCPKLREIINPAEAIGKRGAGHFINPNLRAEDNCFMLYSSGTTGRPKGVVHTHQNIAASLLDLKSCWKFVPEDILLNVLPLFHIHGLSFATHLSLISGASMMLEDKFHPLRTMEKIRDATVFMAVPTIYYAFLRRPEFRVKAKEWDRTRLFTCGSAPIRPEVLPELEAILDTHLINRYGMTESHVITSLPLNGPFPQGSVGLPLDGMEMKLIAEDGRKLSAGTARKDDRKAVGEVKVRSVNLFSHYWNNPAATASAFDQDGFFSTGDLGYLDELGFLTLVGRKTDLIITNGYNVYPAVVERVLNSYPQVRESAVIGVPDKRRGEKVIAIVAPDGRLQINELKAHCLERLARYQVPTHFELVDELPRNAMGKILKRVLRDRTAEPDAESDAEDRAP
jgi:malonyl-CoA/methylmalonyl-CoA synthetase